MIVQNTIKIVTPQIRINDTENTDDETWPEWSGALDPDEQYVYSVDTIFFETCIPEYNDYRGKVEVVISDEEQFERTFDTNIFVKIASIPLTAKSLKLDIGDIYDEGLFIISVLQEKLNLIFYAKQNPSERDKVFIKIFY